MVSIRNDDGDYFDIPPQMGGAESVDKEGSGP